ncbi:MAG: DUF1549 domain-containing protein [Pirellulales bacterium]
MIRVIAFVAVGLLLHSGAVMKGSAATVERPAGSADGTPPQAELINEQLRTGWADQQIAPCKDAPDGAWCRRVYLDLVGRIPTVKELQTYLKDRKSGKRQRLVDRLLGDEYLEEYATHWTTVWTNVLIGRTGGTAQDSMASRPGMQQYLRRSFQKNKPYDRLAMELITATGSCQPGDEDFNGAANFLADKMAEEGVQATARTAQIFLGTAVQCTQCHNHPFNEWKQNQFWELNAFFRQTGVERIASDTNRRGLARVVDRDFAGQGGDPAKAEIYYELRNGKLKVAYPVFVDGTSLAAKYAEKGEDFGDSGYLANVNRRQELAQLVIGSPQFGPAIVNRMWSHFLGYGFTKPIDDMGPHNAASHPELMERLAEEFKNSSYNLRELQRWIVLSDAYALDSRMTKQNEKDDPALGTRPMFSHFYLRQMQAEQLYESLLTATGAADALSYDQREEVKQRWLEQFNTAFGNDENGEATTFNGSIPQALMMMNGELIRKATSTDPGSFLARIAGDAKLDNAEKIDYLYLAALARQPERDELALSNQLLAAREGNVGAALQDIWWALLNSNEFILNH